MRPSPASWRMPTTSSGAAWRFSGDASRAEARSLIHRCGPSTGVERQSIGRADVSNAIAGRRLMNWKIKNVVAGAAAVAVACATVACATNAGAQDYPNRRITFIVGFAAGGFADSVARIIGEHVSKTLGQTVLVENRGGAASNIAARAVAIAPADGYTVLVSTTSLAINATLYKKLEYALLDDLVPVAIAVRAPETFSVSSSKPQTLQKFIEAARSAQLTFSSAGVGSGSHLTWFSFFRTMPRPASSMCRSVAASPPCRRQSVVRSTVSLRPLRPAS